MFLFPGSYATDITNCRANADMSAANATCGAGVKLCMVKTTYTDDTRGCFCLVVIFTISSLAYGDSFHIYIPVGTVSATVHGCDDTSMTALATCKNTSSTVNVCYCDAELCNDITKCLCSSTPYANIADNTEAENGAHGVIATALTTVLSAVGAFWLL